MGRSDFLFARPSLIGGFARLFDFAGTLNVYNASPNETEADSRALRQDWIAVGDYLRAALAKYREEQASHG